MPLKVGDVVRLSTSRLAGITTGRKFYPRGVGVIIATGSDPSVWDTNQHHETYNVEFRYRTDRIGRNWYFEDELDKLSTREAAQVLAEHVLEVKP